MNGLTSKNRFLEIESIGNPPAAWEVWNASYLHNVFRSQKLKHSIWGVFELFKQFSGVGLNFPDDKDICKCISGSYSI